VVLTGISPIDFNNDPQQQEAFAQAILGSLPSEHQDAEVTDIVARSARRRRLQAGSVEVSYTIVIEQDETEDVTDGGASILSDVTTSLSAAVSSGEFLQTLIEEAAVAGSSAAAAFQSVQVDEVATTTSIATASVKVVATTPSPVVAPTTSPTTQTAQTAPAPAGGGGGSSSDGGSMLIIIVVVVVVVLGCGAAAAYYVKKGGSIAAKDIERVADDDEEGQHKPVVNPVVAPPLSPAMQRATAMSPALSELLAQDSETAVPDLLKPLEASPVQRPSRPRVPTATDEATNPAPPLRRAQSLRRERSMVQRSMDASGPPAAPPPPSPGGERSTAGPPRVSPRVSPRVAPLLPPGQPSPQSGKPSSFSLRRERSTRRLDAPARVSPRVAPLQPPKEPDDQSPNQVTPSGAPLRRENSFRGPPRREAPEFSPSAAPGSLQRASSLRRERSTRQLSTRQLAPPETPTRVSPRVVPLGAGQSAPETTTRVSPRVAPAGRSLRRENSSSGPPRRVAPEFAADPEPLGQAAATEAAAGEAPETAAAPPLQRAQSLRRERSSRKL